MPSPKFQFYEIVRVVSRNDELTEIQGQRGAILGMSEDVDNTVRYGVFIFRDEICWNLDEDDLEAADECARREDFYDGTSIHVQVDEEGRGWPAD